MGAHKARPYLSKNLSCAHVASLARISLAVGAARGHVFPVHREENMKVVGRPRARSWLERFDRLQAMVAPVAARPAMRRGTVLRFRNFDEFEAWKRQTTRADHASRNPATS